MTERRKHRFRQSQLNTWLMCPEQLRLEMAGLLPRTPTEATEIGTAVHFGIEQVLSGACQVEDGMDAAMTKWDELSRNENMRWVKASAQQASAFVANCFDSWCDAYPSLPMFTLVEEQFEVKLYEDDQQEIWLAGTIDALDEHGTVWDWKTAASLNAYAKHEIPRKVQPNVYTYAAHHLWDSETPEFCWGIMVKAAKPKPLETITVTRGPGDWKWLTQQCLALAAMIEADFAPWPLNDQGWHCSPRWCNAWDQCKGSYIS